MTGKVRGYIIYRGPSMIDGKPIVAVVTAVARKSFNRKTGDMVQTYILVDNDKSPVTNAAELADVSICGFCKHRRGVGGACYVNLGQGARAVADGVRRNIYPQDPIAAALACRGRMVRLGSYGDPAAIPVTVWHSLLSFAAGHTGYTHQWGATATVEHMSLLMASADSSAERASAKAAGYRTFRVRSADEPAEAGEFTCPASHEAGQQRHCQECMACSGGVNSRKADPVIVVHGALARRFQSVTSD